MAGRVQDKVAIVVGGGQTPGETIGNGRATAILLARERLVQPVRLIGVSASALAAEQTGQLGLLEDNAVRRERLARAVDRITGRFGLDAIRPATLVRRRPREE